MRLPTRDTRLLLLLAPSLATALVPAVVADAADVTSVDTLESRADAADKVAPVDGNDGRPHNGPWVETDGKVDDRLPPLDGRPDDPTVVDGQKIPDSHDGVMNDPNREVPKEGTRGTEGGVSEKEKERKEQEITGERVERTPETPKEVPPGHAHEEEGPAAVDAVVDDDTAPKVDGEASGLEVREFDSTPDFLCVLTISPEARRPPRSTQRSPDASPRIGQHRPSTGLRHLRS